MLAPKTLDSNLRYSWQPYSALSSSTSERRQTPAPCLSSTAWRGSLPEKGFELSTPEGAALRLCLCFETKSILKAAARSATTTLVLQPENTCTEKTMPPADSQTCQLGLASVFQEVPHITAFLCPQSRAALSVCSRHLRLAAHSITRTLTITGISDLDMVFSGHWPCLSLILLRNWWGHGKSLPRGQQHQLTCLMMLNLQTYSKQCVAYIVAAKPKAYQGLPETEAEGSMTLSEGASYSTPLLDMCKQSVQTAVRYFGSSEWQQAHVLVLKYHLLAESIAHLGTGDWRSISHLSLAGLRLGATQIAGLFKSSWPSLQWLDLTSNKLDATAVEALVQASLPQLTDLEIGDSMLNDTAVAQLARGQWPMLCNLSLGFTSTMSADGAAVLMGRWPLLMNLSVTANRVGTGLLSALSCHHGHLLHELCMSSCVLDSSALSGLVHSPFVASRQLHLGSCRLGADAIATLVMVKMPTLTGLHLDGNMLDEAAMTSLVTGSWPQLLSLTLSRNLLNNAAMRVLAQGHWARLHTLQLADNDIDVKGIEYLKQRPWPSLVELSLSKSQVCAAMWEALGLVYTDFGRFAQASAPHPVCNEFLREPLAGDVVWPVLHDIVFVCRSVLHRESIVAGVGTKQLSSYAASTCLLSTRMYVT